MKLEGASDEAKTYSKYTTMTELKKDFKTNESKTEPILSSRLHSARHESDDADEDISLMNAGINKDQTERLIQKVLNRKNNP